MADQQVQDKKPAEDDGIVSKAPPSPQTQPTEQAKTPAGEAAKTDNVRKDRLTTTPAKADDKKLEAPVDPKISALCKDLQAVPDLLKDKNNLHKVKATIDQIKALEPKPREAFTADFKKKTGLTPLDYFSKHVLKDDPKRREPYVEIFEGKKLSPEDIDNALVGSSATPTTAPASAPASNPGTQPNANATAQGQPQGASQMQPQATASQQVGQQGVIAGTNIARDASDFAERVALDAVSDYFGGAGADKIARGITRAHEGIEQGRTDGLRATGGTPYQPQYNGQGPQTPGQVQNPQQVIIKRPQLIGPKVDAKYQIIDNNGSPVLVDGYRVYEADAFEDVYDREKKAAKGRISQVEKDIDREWEQYKKDHHISGLDRVFNRDKDDAAKDGIKKKYQASIESIEKEIRDMEQEKRDNKERLKRLGLDDRNKSERIGDGAAKLGINAIKGLSPF